ncbi:MAG: S8 family serine peptidase, partial [Bacteroides sp.]
EQDYWAEAVEFADSVGVDVVNTSLGYYNFDNSDWNYAYRHLNGSYALMSRQASRMAGKGMLLVCSAGNSGAGSWKKITPPADAFDVLTVGAIDKEGTLASFSSIGTTADGRLKPDVVALGEMTSVIMADGSQGRANGTSYSSPIICGMVTCLWQALPQLTVRQLLEVVRQSANRAEYPDNIYGYGIPDFWKAYQSQK